MKNNQLPRLTIVVPCYNEEPVLPNSAPILQTLLQHLIDNQQITTDSKLLFVDDGSQDQTWALITQLHHQDPLFTGLQFSRNYGQEAALMAGMQVPISIQISLSLLMPIFKMTQPLFQP